MERSIINEFKNSSSTLFHSTALGTNSLLAQRSPKEHDIYKSRIAHLPSDHHQDLTRKLDFVVVFQSIQLERLTQQITFLRGRLRELDGRTLNANSYEVQIRELMQKCNKLENQKYSYRQQLSQTKDASENIFNELSILKSRYADVDFCVAEKYKLQKSRNQQLCLEIEKWKSRYNSLQKIKNQQLQGYKRLLQTQKQSLMNRQTKDIISRFQLQKQELLGRLRDRKQQLDERQLQIKKLHNCYEQLQVRLREDNQKIQSYEQKVALLSQQTFRLNELMRAKHEQIRSIKLMHQQDFSLRMSRFTSLDQTKNQLNDKVRFLEDENDQLRQQNRILVNDISNLKRKISQIQRLQFQIKQMKNDSDNKLKALERKDKRIISLQEYIRANINNSDEIKRLKGDNQRMKHEIIHLKQRIDDKIEQLQIFKKKQINFIKWRDEFVPNLQNKQKLYEQMYRNLQRTYSEVKNISEQNYQKSNNYELKIKEFNIQMKQKDYKISSLQNQIKQIQVKGKVKQAQNRQTIQNLQQKLGYERRNFEQRVKQIDNTNKESEQYIRQAEFKARDFESRYRQIESRLKDYEMSSNSNALKARSLQAQCNDLQLWGKSLQANNHQLQSHIHQLENNIHLINQQNSQLKFILQQQYQFYKTAQQRYFQIGQDLKSLKFRLQNIQKLLISIKTNVTLKLKSAEDSDYRLHQIQDKYEELLQWFLSVWNHLNDPQRLKQSPTKSPYSKLFTSTQMSRNSPFRDQSFHNSSQLKRARSSERTRQNINNGNRDNQIPVDFLLRHVLICVQVQSLRKKVGDKNAKVESMRNSIIVKGYNQSSGFYSTRQPSAGKKTNIYY